MRWCVLQLVTVDVDTFTVLYTRHDSWAPVTHSQRQYLYLYM